MQGRSLVPLLDGGPADWRQDFYCEHLFEHPLIPKSEGVRTTRWKYIKYVELPASDEEQRREGDAVKGGIGRRIRGGNRYEELYDLESDPLEADNVIDDPRCRDTLDRLVQRFAELRDEAASARPSRAD